MAKSTVQVHSDKMARLRLKGTEKLELVGSLATMLGSGISIMEVVSSLKDDAKPGTTMILTEMEADLGQGKRMWSTLAKFPRVFDKVSVNVIRASEEAGTLDMALKDLKSTLQKNMEFGDKVRSALMYPAFIIIVFVLILFLILTFVVPKIATVFTQMRVVLPLPTRILIFMSDLIVKNPVWFFGGITLFGILTWYLFTYKRREVMEFFYKLPLIKTLVAQIDVTNFGRNLSLLLASGLPITQSLELAEEVVVRKSMQQLIEYARKMVLAGKAMSAGLKGSKNDMPSIAIKLIEAGEKTGTLEKSMKDVSDYFEYKVDYTLKTLTALMEPVMLVLVGIAVGGMMLAIIAPIYGLISQVGR